MKELGKAAKSKGKGLYKKNKASEKAYESVSKK